MHQRARSCEPVDKKSRVPSYVHQCTAGRAEADVGAGAGDGTGAGDGAGAGAGILTWREKENSEASAEKGTNLPKMVTMGEFQCFTYLDVLKDEQKSTRTKKA